MSGYLAVLSFHAQRKGLRLKKLLKRKMIGENKKGCRERGKIILEEKLTLKPLTSNRVKLTNFYIQPAGRREDDAGFPTCSCSLSAEALVEEALR